MEGKQNCEVSGREALSLSKRLFFLCLLMIMLTFFILFFAEYFLRWYYKDVLSTADGRSYFSLKAAPLFKKELNGYRLRGKAFPAEADDKYRVVVLGDSLTYGQGVYPAEKRFTEQVEHLFGKDNPKIGFFVANAGIAGHDLIQHNKYLSFIDQIHPDFVLYQWYINDMDILPKFSRIVTPTLFKNKKIHIFLWQHSVFYYLIQTKYGQWRRKTGKQESYADYLISRIGDPDAPYSQAVKVQLVKLIRHFKEKKIDFGIVLFPSVYLDLSKYKLDFLHDRVMNICQLYDVPCLDLRSTFQDINHAKLWANRFDPHPGELAHSMAAQAIYKFFGDDWLQKAIIRDEKMKKTTLPRSVKKME